MSRKNVVGEPEGFSVWFAGIVTPAVTGHLCRLQLPSQEGILRRAGGVLCGPVAPFGKARPVLWKNSDFPLRARFAPLTRGFLKELLGKNKTLVFGHDHPGRSYVCPVAGLVVVCLVDWFLDGWPYLRVADPLCLLPFCWR